MMAGCFSIDDKKPPSQPAAIARLSLSLRQLPCLIKFGMFLYIYDTPYAHFVSSIKETKKKKKKKKKIALRYYFRAGGICFFHLFSICVCA